LNICDNPFPIDIIAVSPINNPKLQNGLLTDEDYDLTYMKIDTIFQIAQMKKHDSIILSAFGCGGDHNPIYQIIDIFNNCILRWKHSFKIIIFAVLSKEKINDKTLNQNTGLMDNYFYFKQCIKMK
jgi:uncharacterized protein (TIGR02452 family)